MGSPAPFPRSQPHMAAPPRTLHVAHVITALVGGGAEEMLYKVVTGTRVFGLTHAVVSLIDGGPMASALSSEGIPVSSLRMREGIPDVRAVPRLARWLRRERPDVIQSWMYHADLVAGVAALAAGRVPVVWGIRHADVDPRHAKRLTHWTRSLCARLSGVLPTRIVCCADAALRSHAALGYHADRMIVIPNGFDLERFAPDPVARECIRRELALPEHALVVGMLGRFHPDKDHGNFLAAARFVADANRDAMFVLAGEGVEWSNSILHDSIRELGIEPRVRLLGRRADAPSLLATMDVLASPSRSEAFSNVLGEAMSCRVPCAATDCGDSRDIVGSTGRIVPPEDPAALARAILELLALSPTERASLGAAGQERVRRRYDMRAVASHYAALYSEVCKRGAIASA